MKTKVDVLNEVSGAYTVATRATVSSGSCKMSTSGKSPNEGPTICCGFARFIDPDKAPDWVWRFGRCVVGSAR